MRQRWRETVRSRVDEAEELAGNVCVNVADREAEAITEPESDPDSGNVFLESDELVVGEAAVEIVKISSIQTRRIMQEPRWVTLVDRYPK